MLTNMISTPKTQGYTMPPEWVEHECVWTGYPSDNNMWLGYLEVVRQDFTAFLRVLSSFERVELICRNEEALQDAKARLEGCHVSFHLHPHNDVWFRDCAPIFITKEQEIAAIDWKFNGWGNKFDADLDDQIPEFICDVQNIKRFQTNVVMEGGALEVNGAGVLLTTRQCLLEKHRNPSMSESQLEQSLRDNLGVEKILWLEDGMENDHTDGHIDTISRFVSSHQIVTCICEDVTDSNYAVLEKNLALLKTFTDLQGQPFEIITLPLPKNRMFLSGEMARAEGVEGDRLPPTYANFYIGNGCVIVPTYNDPNDQRALEILKPLFPNRQVIGSSSHGLIHGGGSFHCVTQQQPRV
jgi:agmatine deiminase